MPHKLLTLIVALSVFAPAFARAQDDDRGIGARSNVAATPHSRRWVSDAAEPAAATTTLPTRVTSPSRKAAPPQVQAPPRGFVPPPAPDEDPFGGVERRLNEEDAEAVFNVKPQRAPAPRQAAPQPARSLQPSAKNSVQPVAYEEPSSDQPTTVVVPASANVAAENPSSATLPDGGPTPVEPAVIVARPVPKHIPLPLEARGKAPSSKNQGPGDKRAASQAWSPLATVAGSLTLVLGLFFLAAWAMRRAVPRQVPTLPQQVVEVLGRMPMPGRQQMQLLRIGNKLLLIHLSLGGAETLTEITDPEEVDRLAGLCQAGQSNSSSSAFQDVLAQLGRQRRSPDFLDQDAFGLELAGVANRRGGANHG